MGTDFSKVLLNGLLNYSGVKLGQGRVLLDSDFNELSDIFDRRMRALASDVLDRATVSSTTPDAFKIEAPAGGLTIGIGRLYVDGLLAECHGAKSLVTAERVLDDVLDEARFAKPVPYAAQPYLPQPKPLPTTGTHLVYLDVWQRPVTHLEQPNLVEAAVGVDAGAREQFAWQVHVLGPIDGDSTCATPDGELTAWADLIAPSSGVLTTGTYEVAPATDPCDLPPTGGYRGLENRLYRVEIHDPGQPGGAATFKWSGENKSVGSRIVSIVNGSEVEVESLGHDDMLSFKTDDWVEFINDYTEFAQGPGAMRKITVNAAKRRMTFTPPLPADLAPGPFPDSTSPAARNLRVRRWEQKEKIYRTDPSGPIEVQNLDSGTSGVIKVPAAGTTLILENGVTVEFGSTGTKGFRTGDYWVFAARTTDASVEELDRARPRGIWHNYARLAIWDAAAGTLTDCRNKWPPKGGDDCSCTACVTADSHNSGQFTIQAAVDKVKPTGGTVCLGPGQYKLVGPVRIDGATSLRIRGQGLASLIVATAGQDASAGAFEISGSLFTGIEDLGILSIGDLPAIRVDSAIGLSLKRIVALVIGREQGTGTAISLQGAVAAATIADNVIFASTGIFANAFTTINPNSTSGAGETTILLAAALAIDDNIFLCDRRAVALDGNVLHFLGTRITGNEVLGCRDAAISALGFGLDASSMRISRNDLAVSGIGIRCGVEGISIEGNKLTNSETRVEKPPHAITLIAGADRGGIDQCHILANQIKGFGGAGIHVGTPVRALIAKQNIIENCGQGITCSSGEMNGKLTIENNQLMDIGPPEGPLVVAMGIVVLQATSATIAGNTIRTLGLAPAGMLFCVAIFVGNVAHSRILGNEAADIGPPGTFKGAVRGIVGIGSLDDFEIDYNRIERQLGSTSDNIDGDWQALTISGSTQPSVSTTAGALADNSPASLRVGTVSVVTLDGQRFLAASRFNLPSGSILGNVFHARGTQPAVEVRADECLFNDNRVRALSGDAVPAVLLAGRVTVVSANRIRGGDPSLRIANAPGQPATVLGNITTAPIQVAGGLGTPFVPLNLIG